MAEIGIAGRETPDGLVLRTRGLAAGGVPELRITGLPPYLGHAWARLLAVLAQRLAQHPGGLPNEIILTPHDMTTTPPADPPLGDPPGGAGVRIMLAVVGGHLEPGPPDDFAGDAGQWRRETVLKLLPTARS